MLPIIGMKINDIFNYGTQIFSSINQFVVSTTKTAFTFVTSKLGLGKSLGTSETKLTDVKIPLEKNLNAEGIQIDKKEQEALEEELEQLLQEGESKMGDLGKNISKKEVIPQKEEAIAKLEEAIEHNQSFINEWQGKIDLLKGKEQQTVAEQNFIKETEEIIRQKEPLISDAKEMLEKLKKM